MEVRNWLGVVGALALLLSQGNVHAYTDMLTYKYDGLNRLKEAKSGAAITQIFTHDDVANRLTEVRLNAPIGAPTALSDVYSLTENTSLIIDAASGVLANDLSNAATNLTAIEIAPPLFGTFTLSSDGAFSYTPNAEYYGDDEFAYQINSDTFSSNIVRVRLSVLAEVTTPVGNNDVAEVIEDQSVTISVLANDENVTSVIAVDTPFHGTAVMQGIDQILYTPESNYVGQDIFNYVAQGPEGTINARVNVTVTAVNDSPVLVNIEHWMDWSIGVTATIPVLLNASDPDGDDLTLISANYSSSPTHGTVSVQGDNVIYIPTEFVPNDNSGTLMSEFLTYTVEDSEGNQAQANISARVSDNQLPTAIDDCYDISVAGTSCFTSNSVYEIEYESATLLPVLFNDFDPAGEQLVLVSTSATQGLGSAVIQGDQILYTPNSGIEDQIDTFTYQIEDAQGQSAIATVTVFIKAYDVTNYLPTPKDDCYNSSASVGCMQSTDYLIDYNTATMLDVMSNDTDPNGEILNLDTAFIPSSSNGSVSIVGNQLQYVPDSNGDIDGFQDNFIYRVKNASGLTAEATAYVYVKPRDNKAPVARNDSYIAFMDEPRDFKVTLNDDDPNFDDLDVIAGSITSPSHGVAERIDASTIRYTPTNNHLGADSFRYKVTDGNGLDSGEAFVTITVKVKKPWLVPIIDLIIELDEEVPEGEAE